MTSSHSSSNPLIFPLSTSRGWKKPERIIEEIKPIKSDNENNQQSSSCCQVCQEHNARYTCPRCQISYCSMQCYRNHNNEASSACTEEFYKRKVNDLMKLESLESQEENQKMLQKIHSSSQQNNNVDDLAVEAWEQEELYELFQKLEEMGENVDELSPKQLEALVPASLRRKFQREIQQGKVQELILTPWHPWWRRQLVGGEEVKDESVLMEDRAKTISTPKQQSLDERLLKVPAFKVKSKTSQTLLFNLMDILYATCSTLRLYHGVKNAASNAPIEAAASLISTSTVLSKDARYTSLEEVLSQCIQQRVTGAMAKSNSVHDDSMQWSELVEDLALLATSHRLVGRALLEASDILKAAIKELKQEDTEKGTGKTAKESSTDDSVTQKEHLERLRRLRKKLEFFLSWSQHHEYVKLFQDDCLKDSIMAWRDNWKSVGGNRDGDENDDLEMNPLKLSLPP